MPELAPSGFLVMAAGRSRRFGEHDKLMSMLAGKPLIAHCLDSIDVAAQASGSPVVVCLDASQQGGDASSTRLQQWLCEQGRDVCLCDDATHGFGHSVAAAVRAHPHWQGWFICLADMPAIRADTYAALLAASTDASILAPVFGGQRGHPVYFHHEWRDALCALRGDQGAKGIIQQNPGQLRLLSVDDPGITLDIDAPSDLNTPLLLEVILQHTI